jgi:hypothetical protein
MDSYLASYIFCYYQRFMTAKEKLANRHLTATAKATHRRTDVAAQKEARNTRMHLRDFLSADPEVPELPRDGRTPSFRGRPSASWPLTQMSCT